MLQHGRTIRSAALVGLMVLSGLALAGHRRNRGPQPAAGPAAAPVVSREFTLFHMEGPAAVSAVVSREISIHHVQPASIAPIVSREFSMHNAFDCNNNGVPDDQDIIDGTSQDANEDFAPDECTNFSNVCVGPDNDLWSCFDNWEDIPNNTYPDNVVFIGPFTPTLDNDDDAFLDVDVTIDALRIVDQALLRVNQTAGAGDLTIATTSGLLLAGTLQVGEDRTIDVSAGAVIVEPGGVYQSIAADPAPSGTLLAGTLRVLEGAVGALIRLTGDMAVLVNNDVTISGPSDPSDGDCTPMDFAVVDDGDLDIGGDLIFGGAVDLEINSSMNVELGGTLINESTGNLIFDWGDGGLSLTGTIGTAHAVEAAGRDLGDLPAGLNDNFAFGRLELQSNNTLSLVDAFDNDALGATPCTEALYVDDLGLGSGSTLTLTDASLYYVRLQDDGATIELNGCAVLACIRFPHGDVDENGRIDVDDILCGLDGFGDVTGCPGADLFPCGGDGTIDLMDIISLLNAFAGAFDCPDACVGN